jgi:hypothetical protein
VDKSPLSGDKYPLPPVSPLIYDKMSEIGGTIPNIYLLKFSRKIDPLLKKDMYFCKKNFWKIYIIYYICMYV